MNLKVHTNVMEIIGICEKTDMVSTMVRRFIEIRRLESHHSVHLVRLETPIVPDGLSL